MAGYRLVLSYKTSIGLLIYDLIGISMEKIRKYYTMRNNFSYLKNRFLRNLAEGESM